MTSFMFEGPAIGGPANGRILMSHTEIFTALYLVQGDATTRHTQALIRSQRIYGKFRYRAHNYGIYQFFLPAHQSLSYFLAHWNPPIGQIHWPVFLESAITILKKQTQKESPYT